MEPELGERMISRLREIAAQFPGRRQRGSRDEIFASFRIASHPQSPTLRSRLEKLVIGSGDEVFGPGAGCPVAFTITAIPVKAENILMGVFVHPSYRALGHKKRAPPANWLHYQVNDLLRSFEGRSGLSKCANLYEPPLLYWSNGSGLAFLGEYVDASLPSITVGSHSRGIESHTYVVVITRWG
jgi:hypothetical protein